MSSLVQKEMRKNGVVLITLDRPEAANAFSRELLTDLEEVLTDVAQDDDVRVVVMQGAGGKVFSAGADLKERKEMTEGEVTNTVARIRGIMEQTEKLPQPVIAAMNGSALGGGLELALACDLRVALGSASYGLTETSLAIVPGAGGTQRLPRLIGRGRAKDLMLTARRINGFEALSIGLSEYAAETADEVVTTALSVAEKIAANGPIAVQSVKQAVNEGMNQSFASGIEAECKAYDRVLSTEDRLEGLQAFKEKRAPNYLGK
ncbi:short chain enoyl-CoA hydratase [Salsuginibacillus halophilus]|uniref:Short chain enoyl-CoA hydratase n=1 Tax=Salsuginibacillus halophilus TaxID=517424 RepID=A0A2P8HG58_9BACI|nr:enoyl-CoA hydratase-related protein [Salsuginibacillus halophilus]PSL45180.1 short chain enoyl-CoA hydratase [Salsuginibacillus halophilus]